MKILKLMMAVLVWGSLHAQEKKMETVVKEYLQLKDVILAGDADQASIKAKQLVGTMEELAKSSVQELRVLAEDLVKMVKTLAAFNQIEKQREELGKLSEPFWNFIKETDPVSIPLYYNYCPMKKAYWISDSNVIQNPFYGKQMLSCGKTVESIKN